LLDLGVVAIGRNEGERLLRCFDSLPAGALLAVYVDSASTDDSVVQARRRGIDVVELDMSVPFTAARARNAGLRRLEDRCPGLGFVQFVDGDCALVSGWIEAAAAELESNPRLAVVCGRRREVNPGASVYNRLSDMEWDTPVGEAQACGGDALMRVVALREVGGYDERLIAGEEPEMCGRLRARGWRIRRIAREMTLHDAAMIRFGQWWRRSVRSGYGFAEGAARRPPMWRRELRSCVAWGLVLPSLVLFSLPFAPVSGLVLLMGYGALWLRILAGRRVRGDVLGNAGLYATFCVLGKFSELTGAAKYWTNRTRGRQGRLIEYK
jgi:glycosyltransferase involved in cell wall biosynthesis